jgi:hypothetical protein
MDPSTINSATFKVSGSCGVITYDQASRTATYTPSVPFARWGNYSVTVSKEMKDLAGNSLDRGYETAFSVEPWFDGIFTVGGTNAYTGSTCDGAISVHIVLTLNGNTLAADSTCTDCYLRPLNQLGADAIGPLSTGQDVARIRNLVGYTTSGSLVVFDFGLDNGRSFHFQGSLTSDKSINGYFGGTTLPKAGIVLIRP